MTPTLPFAALLGIQIIESTPDRVAAELLVRDPHPSRKTNPGLADSHFHPRRPTRRLSDANADGALSEKRC